MPRPTELAEDLPQVPPPPPPPADLSWTADEVAEELLERIQGLVLENSQLKAIIKKLLRERG